nr:uncharacterized protein LOC128696473 [Cherax quadricarinatus]
MLVSRSATTTAPSILLLLCSSLAFMPLAAAAPAPAHHPTFSLLLPRAPLQESLQVIPSEESSSDEEMGVVLDPVMARTFLQYLSTPTTDLSSTATLPRPAPLDLARLPLKRQVRQNSVSNERVMTSRVSKPNRQYLTNPRYFVESLGGKVSLILGSSPHVSLILGSSPQVSLILGSSPQVSLILGSSLQMLDLWMTTSHAGPMDDYTRCWTCGWLHQMVDLWMATPDGGPVDDYTRWWTCE